MVVGILKVGSESLEILNVRFVVVAAATTSNEVVKELLIEFKFGLYKCCIILLLFWLTRIDPGQPI
jgi:hypothetical protein